jgi:hypothetical protein
MSCYAGAIHTGLSLQPQNMMMGEFTVCGTKPTLGFPTSLAQHFLALAAGFLQLRSIRHQSSH